MRLNFFPSYFYVYVKLAVLLLFLCQHPRICAAEEKLISPETINIDKSVAARISGGDGAARDIQRFIFEFTAGRESLLSGEYREAVGYLVDARRTWPEYFDTDLLLGLAYEGMGKDRRAARYYKSYLNKLREFHQGHFRISAPIIYTINASPIPDYDVAYYHVADHLSGMGIDIDTVRPVSQFPAFLLPLGTVMLLAGVFLLGRFIIVPGIKRRQRLLHPPEGFWVCPRCGKENPVIAIECGDCGHPREA